ncbi:unnamed protein product [Chrysoparadoxa australica]
MITAIKTSYSPALPNVILIDLLHLSPAYIADTVPQVERANAYGLALATFGLSYTIGPIGGGYLADAFGFRAVFAFSAVLTALDVLYILTILPETRVRPTSEEANHSGGYLPFRWNPLASLQIFKANKLLSHAAVIVFLYYSAVWAIVSTLMVYVTREFHFTTVMVGQLLSAFGVCTMIAEGMLVRLLVPMWGERFVVMLGLLGFASQCIMIGIAWSPWLIFLSMGGSMLSNLVYPSISSLVSRNVAVHAQGEVLGAINGVRALTEGFGPLAFGTLMSASEHTPLPGAPYLIAAGLAMIAVSYAKGLPDGEELQSGPLGVDEGGAEESSGLLEMVDGDGGELPAADVGQQAGDRGDNLSPMDWKRMRWESVKRSGEAAQL